MVVDHDTACIGADESGDAIERQCLARAAGSEKDGDAGRGCEREVEREASRFGTRAVLFPDAGLNHRAVGREPYGFVVSRLAIVRIASASAETTITRVRARDPLPDSTAS